MSSTATPPEGWYDDPRQPEIQRYWDGSSWTESTRPVPVASSALVETQTTAVEEAPPPWAAEVVAAEAATYSTTPWWKKPAFVALSLLMAGVVAVGLFLALSGESDDELAAGDPENTAREIAEPDETVSTTAVDVATDPATDDTPSSSAPASETVPPAAPAVVTEADTSPTSVEPSDTEALPEEAETTSTEATETTSTAESTTTTTTTSQPGAGTDGVSADCLAAMQFVAEIPEEAGTPEDLLSTFIDCSTEQEWQQAATSTGVADRVDVDTAVPVGCVVNLDLYTLPLCESTIDPNSGPRRIDCGDERQDIEWLVPDDTRSNDQVCADHFQIQCGDGTIHNIPYDALSPDEAEETICL